MELLITMEADTIRCPRGLHGERACSTDYNVGVYRSLYKTLNGQMSTAEGAKTSRRVAGQIAASLERFLS